MDDFLKHYETFGIWGTPFFLWNMMTKPFEPLITLLIWDPAPVKMEESSFLLALLKKSLQTPRV